MIPLRRSKSYLPIEEFELLDSMKLKGLGGVRARPERKRFPLSRNADAVPYH
jgi:hypothetical protein